MHGRNYREVKGMAYTRKEFAPGAPNPRIARFTIGKPREDYDSIVSLVSLGKAQIRHNALEAARVAANKKLASIGEDSYYLVVKVYPHIILRENKMIATAGADRLQEGMRKAFGKPVGLAARVDVNNTIMEIKIKSENLQKAKEALEAAAAKLPVKTKIDVKPLVIQK